MASNDPLEPPESHASWLDYGVFLVSVQFCGTACDDLRREAGGIAKAELEALRDCERNFQEYKEHMEATLELAYQAREKAISSVRSTTS